MHVCVGDHGRVACVEVLPDEKGETAAACLECTVTWNEAKGVRCRRDLTDNGSRYISQASTDRRSAGSIDGNKVPGHQC